MAGGAQPKFEIKPFDKKKHDRAAFCCGDEALDRYLQKQASQDSEKRVAAVFVLTADDRTIAGFYTLSQYTIELGSLPVEAAKSLRLPKYPHLPATLLGRLAVDQSFQGQQLGELLLFGAMQRALDLSRSVASMAIVVDAKDDHTRRFYSKYGFLALPDHRNRLFLPMMTVEGMFQ